MFWMGFDTTRLRYSHRRLMCLCELHGAMSKPARRRLSHMVKTYSPRRQLYGDFKKHICIRLCFLYMEEELHVFSVQMA